MSISFSVSQVTGIIPAIQPARSSGLWNIIWELPLRPDQEDPGNWFIPKSLMIRQLQENEKSGLKE
jgi:hypothetical protein